MFPLPQQGRDASLRVPEIWLFRKRQLWIYQPQTTALQTAELCAPNEQSLFFLMFHYQTLWIDVFRSLTSAISVLRFET